MQERIELDQNVETFCVTVETIWRNVSERDWNATNSVKKNTALRDYMRFAMGNAWERIKASHVYNRTGWNAWKGERNVRQNATERDANT